MKFTHIEDLDNDPSRTCKWCIRKIHINLWHWHCNLYSNDHNCGDTTPTTLPPAITSPTLSRTVIFTWGPLEYPLWGTSSVCTDGCGFPCPRPRILEGNLPELSCPESAGGSKHGQIITVTHSGHRVLNDGQVREPPLSRGDPGDRRHGGHWRMCTDVSATSTVWSNSSLVTSPVVYMPLF